VSIKVTSKWTNEGQKLKRELERLNQMEVAVGYQAGASVYPDGTDVVDVAMWNEFGTSRSPSRPFMRDSVDNHRDEIEAFMIQKKGQLMNGASAEQILKDIGIFQKDLVQNEIREGSFQANAPSTIKKKGSSKPLIDSGTMRQSVQYQVRSKGE